MGPRKVVFLDRDGTINTEHESGRLHQVSDWQFAPGAVEGMKLLQEAGFLLTVVTNQTGIGAGYYTTADMRAVHKYMMEKLEEQGVTIDAIAFCPHKPDSSCDCRKPEPGMALHIEEQVGAIDYAASWTIGDKIADSQFGFNTGTHTALIRSRFWTPADITQEPDIYADSLFDAAEKISTL